MPAEPTTLNITEPLAGYRFGVKINKKRWVGIFTECKIPDLDWDVKEHKEGGQNQYVHWLPGRRKGTKFTLKNGLTKDYVLLDWYAAILGEKYEDYQGEVTITLFSALGKPIMHWHLHEAFPVKMVWPDLKTGDNSIAIQTLEFACNKIEFEKA